MNVKQAILERRSIRKYTDQPISDADINDILEAGLYAPSAIDLQHWYYVVVKSPEKMEELKQFMSDVYDKFEPVLLDRFKNNPATIAETKAFLKGLGGAKFVILAFLYKDDYPDVKGAMEGVCAGIQNMLLTAHSKGIGSCWMTAPMRVGMDGQLKEKYAAGHGEFVAAITFGYPAQSPKAPRRKEDRFIII
ncbi:MAG: nitroreductase family protein [Firmicutes bacterium]|nr:nitroreductase family protein [Bacillota bacterium]MBR0104520.1 nitroreductase family protein [Bacillota bacterium]